MSGLGIFDPLLGRLRTDDTTTIEKTETIVRGGVSSAAAGASVQTGITLPATGTDGDIFYDSDDGILYVYANGMWNAISGGGGGVTGTWDFVDGSSMDFVDGSVGDFVT